jgi:hypothetical protein
MGLRERIRFAHASPFPSRYLQTKGIGWGKTPHQFANSILETHCDKLSPAGAANCRAGSWIEKSEVGFGVRLLRVRCLHLSQKPGFWVSGRGGETGFLIKGFGGEAKVVAETRFLGFWALS